MIFSSTDSIKFMMAKVFFNLANFSYQEIKDPTTKTYHGQDTLVIMYVKNGNGKVIINDKPYDISEKTYIKISPFSTYQIIPKTKIDIYTIYLLVDKTTGYKKFFYLLDLNFVGNDRYNLTTLFDTLHYEFKNKLFGYNEIIVSMFKSIIVTILRNEGVSEERLSHWDLDSFQYQIEEILQNEFKTITLNDLATRLFMSTRELQRYLISNYKKSFMDLKNDARMSFASNKLIYSDISISELSDLVGYSSVEHFSYGFKNYYKMSPTAYRKKYKVQE